MKSYNMVQTCDRALEICLWLLFFCLPFTKAGAETFAWMGIAFWLLKRVFGYRTSGPGRIIPTTDLNKALAIFILVNALATIFTINHGLSLRAFFGKELKFLLVYFMVVETINTEKRLRNFFLVMMATVIMITTDAIVQFVRGVDFLRGFTWVHLCASFKSANDFAGWLTIVIPTLFGMAFMRPRKFFHWGLRIVPAFLGMILLGCLFLTYSRGALGGVLLGFVLSAYYLFRKARLKVKTLWFIVFVTLFFFVLFMPASLKGKIESLGNVRFQYTGGETIKERFTSAESFQIRIQLWQAALNIIKDAPLLGAGLNTYTRVISFYKISDDGGIYAHNSFLQMAAETGILGLMAFLWVLYEFFKTGMRSLNKREDYLVLGLLSGILAFLLQSFVDTNLYALQLVVFFWFMMGLTVAVSNVQEGLCLSNETKKTA